MRFQMRRSIGRKGIISNTPGLYPGSISGLRAWFKPESITGNNGDNISSWADSSSYTRTLTAGVTPATVTYPAKNGLKALTWGASSNQYTLSPTMDYTAFSRTVFIVMNRLADGNDMYGLTTTSAWGDNWYTDDKLYCQDGTNQQYTSNAVSAGWKYFTEQIVPNTSGSIWVNGVSQTMGSPLSNSVDLSSISRLWQGTSGTMIGEIIVYDSILSSSNREGVETYLKNKWGF